MPFIDTSTLDVIERLPGWHGRYFHSPSMTFAHYDFCAWLGHSRTLPSSGRGLRGDRGRARDDD